MYSIQLFVDQMIDLLPQIQKFSKNNPHVHSIVDTSKSFMPQFYEQVNDIRKDLSTLNKMINVLQDSQYNVVDIGYNKTKAIHDDINNICQTIHSKLEHIKSYDNVKNDDGINRIISNIHFALSDSFSKLRQNYHIIKKQYDDKMDNIFINHNAYAESNDIGQLQLLTINNKLDVANETYNYVHHRYKDVMKLEKDIQEVNQLFMDVSGLVDKQGEQINRISHHISTGRDHCKDAKEDFEVIYKIKKRTCIIQ